MNSSDSEGFESADEGMSTPTKRERKKRLSSSNYSDNFSDKETKKNVEEVSNKSSSNVQTQETTDGWDNCDDDVLTGPLASKNNKAVQNVEENTTTEDTQSSGWEDFDDWGDTNVITTVKEQPKDLQTNKAQQERDLKLVTNKLGATSAKSEAWGWGWGVDSLLSTASAGISTATAGISTITSQVSQGISTVLETGIGAPDPEELAKRSVNAEESDSKDKTGSHTVVEGNSSKASFQFGTLFSGVTKFVETTGTKVISGGLDTLETIGKKTMEVLQDGDPLLAKKRAMLGLDSGDKPVLSQVLREAKAKADEEDRLREAKKEAKEVHYETLFDDYEGLVHLEALEMLSKQVSMRIEERLRSAPPDKRQDIRETLQQVTELCEMPEEDDDDDEEVSKDTPRADAFHDKLQRATKDIGLKLQFQPLIKQYSDTLEWLEGGGQLTARAVYKRGVRSLAQSTAGAVELYHKCAEMLLVKARRSTADEADALTQMTVVLTRHISELASLFTARLSELGGDDSNNYITNVFLEAGNSSKYIENALQLALPIVQVGAV